MKERMVIYCERRVIITRRTFLSNIFRRHTRMPTTGRLYRIGIARPRFENRKRKPRRAFVEISRNDRSTLEGFCRSRYTPLPTNR